MLKSTRFSDYVTQERVIADLKATEKIEVFEELLDTLVEQGLVKNRKPVLTRIVDREALETTAIGHGIAVPHARIDGGQDIAIAVGRSKEGLDFQAADEEKVNLVFMVVWNPGIPGLFNHLFAGLARYLSRDDFRERLLAAPDGKTFFDTLSEIELHLPFQEDTIVHQAAVLWKLQDMVIRKRKASGSEKSELEKQMTMIRDELDRPLLARFDRLMERYGFAVAEVEHGVCQGCYISIPTQMGSAIEGSNDIYVCENCGKFLVATGER